MKKEKWIKTAFFVYSFLFTSLMIGNSHAIEVCIPRGYGLACNERQVERLGIDPDIIVELEAALGLGFGADEFRIGPLARLGLGYYPLELTAGVDLRSISGLSPFSDTPLRRIKEGHPERKKRFDQSYGAYLKYAGLPPIELSGHYLIEVLRGVKSSQDDSDTDPEVFSGYGLGLGVGVNLLVFTLRADVTYYQFLERVSNGETVKFTGDPHSPEDGVKVDLIVSFPIRFNIDVD
ncbi:MAG: hypothetical protein OXB84_09270 [Halobacteriovoraceae bacterium]|nr:hypothetical protein [Halobacteriovoraceae bacterium]